MVAVHFSATNNPTAHPGSIISQMDVDGTSHTTKTNCSYEGCNSSDTTSLGVCLTHLKSYPVDIVVSSYRHILTQNILEDMEKVSDEHVRNMLVKTINGDVALNLQYTYYIDRSNILYSWMDDGTLRAVAMFNHMKYTQQGALEVYPLTITSKKRDGIIRIMNNRGITVDGDTSWMSRR
jgi:hypothetical protein